jgi:hypothetical protein
MGNTRQAWLVHVELITSVCIMQRDGVFSCYILAGVTSVDMFNSRQPGCSSTQKRLVTGYRHQIIAQLLTYVAIAVLCYRNIGEAGTAV